VLFSGSEVNIEEMPRISKADGRALHDTIRGDILRSRGQHGRKVTPRSYKAYGSTFHDTIWGGILRSRGQQGRKCLGLGAARHTEAHLTQFGAIFSGPEVNRDGNA